VRWKLQTRPGVPLRLRVGYLGGAAAAFDVTVDGAVVASERPDHPAPAAPNRAQVTSIRTYDLPATAASVIEIGFTGHSELGPARIVFCELSERN
jgi:hypothetical protein